MGLAAGASAVGQFPPDTHHLTPIGPPSQELTQLESTFLLLAGFVSIRNSSCEATLGNI